MLNLIPTLTNSIGVEGLLGNTYDNLRDTAGYDVSSKFFKPETMMVNTGPCSEVTRYYLERDPALLAKTPTMGAMLYKDVDHLLNNLQRLEEDGQYWKEVAGSSLDCLKMRSSSQLLDRVLSYNITSLISDIKNIRRERISYQQIWNEYTK